MNAEERLKMVTRYNYYSREPDDVGVFVDYRDYQELEAENARLRQQRDAANAQLDWLIEQTGTKRIIRSNMDECE